MEKVNREIKFRAKSKKTSNWVYGDLLQDQYQGFIVTDDTRETIEINLETIGEYVNLKDKNGKEIYEGDILTFEDYTSDKWILNKELEKAIVKYNQGDCSFAPQDIEENTKGGKYYHYWNQIRSIIIIGNIYENHELLNE